MGRNYLKGRDRDCIKRDSRHRCLQPLLRWFRRLLRNSVPDFSVSPS
jgi:hypothetical protein